MIKIDKKVNPIPKALDSPTKINNLLKSKGTTYQIPKADRDPLWKELEEVYDHKCAYCESKVGDSSRVKEHYRPQNGYPSKEDIVCEEWEKHKGYYWLAYEWSNLLLSCSACNGEEKSSHFPIQGTRATKPVSDSEIVKFLKEIKDVEKKRSGDKDEDWKNKQTKWQRLRKDWLAEEDTLLSEKPLLLHPDIDEPDDYLRFLPDGTIQSFENPAWKGEEEWKKKRGDKTIKIFDLTRDDLRNKRKKIVNELRESLEGMEIF